MRPVFVGGVLFVVAATASATDVLTQHGDAARTGANTSETVLTPANVSGGAFGRVATLRVDGYVYAQPLVASGVSVRKKARDLLFVATEHDRVFAFDVTGKKPRLVWKRSLAPRGERPPKSSEIDCEDLVPEVGITSTPVIDRATDTMYVVAKTTNGRGAFHHRLHALALATGAEKFGGPVETTASVAGTGDGNDAGIIAFDPQRQHQRCGLLLQDGAVFVASASHCDVGPYHGWVLAYDATSLARRGVFNTTPDGGLGGIWQAGGGLAGDGAGVYAATGNGTFAGRNYGDSAIRLSLTIDLSLVDSFTPFNQTDLESADADLGSGGVVLLPDQSGAHVHEMVFAGKEGTIYVVDRDAMGGFHAGSDSQIVQSLPNVIGGVFGLPAYWNGRVFFHANGDTLKAYSVTAGLLSTTPVSDAGINFDFPGATPTVSSNGAADGIVWEIRTDQYQSKGAAVLYAYDATDLTRSLFTSDAQTRDRAGPAVKFAVPTVANGRVYVGGVKRVTVYGLK